MIQAGTGMAAIPVAIGDMILAVDPERWLAVCYAPKRSRAALAALFALDVNLGGVVASTSEPMIGALRLAWWREALEKLPQSPAPAEPVLQAIANEITGKNPSMAAELAAMVDGWLALIEVEALDRHAIETHARERGARLFDIAVRLLNEDGDRAMAARLGRGWALVDLASRLTQSDARDIALETASTELATSISGMVKEGRPLAALAVLARRDAATGLKGRRPGAPLRQLRMLGTLLTGR